MIIIFYLAQERRGRDRVLQRDRAARDAARDVLNEQLSFEEASTRLLLAPDQWLRIIKTK
jgi:hypothetical protein